MALRPTDMIASPCGHGAAARQCVPVHSVSFKVFAQRAALAEQFALRLELSPTAVASFTMAFIAAICVNPEDCNHGKDPISTRFMKPSHTVYSTISLASNGVI